MTTTATPFSWLRSGAAPARRGGLAIATALVVVTALSACMTRPTRAPVEERSPTSRVSVAAASPALEPAVTAPRPVPEVVKGGTYVVKSGDTLIRIGMDSGQNWKDLVRWNNLSNPNLIEVGQVLRIVAPGTDPSLATTRPVGTQRVDPRPLDARASAASAVPLGTPVGLQPPPTGTVTLAATPAPSQAAAPAAKEGDDDVAWAWPVGAGTAPAPFDESRNKGLVFHGKAGEPVLAAADGRVVYAGSGLRGYGNLIILKHNTTYLTAYAHNQKLLVKEDETVRRGQKIAEMGASDADGVQLHFEVRRQGKPIDPTRVLPVR